MKAQYLFPVLMFFCISQSASQCFTCDDVPPGAIFCDDFETTEALSDRYFESGGQIFLEDSVGRDNTRGIRIVWNQGDVGVGGFKKSFGRTPSSYIGSHAVNPDETYTDIYWRLDVRHQPGWQGGGPAKLSRAMTLATDYWAQGMIAHIWSAGNPYNNFLGMDPASGIDENGNLVSTRYNDFANFRWLGFKRGNIDMFSTANSGKWYCIEAHAKLNTPGQNDGIFEFWINDTLQNGTYDLNWHGDWNSDPDNYGINAVFVENYWNDGSPVDQERYMDNFVISTERIKCKCLTTDSEQLADRNEIQIYPNPAQDILQLKVNRERAVAGFQFEIYNSHGQLIWQSAKIHQVRFHYDTRQLEPGIYYYKVIAKGNPHVVGVFGAIR